jgi:ribonuclease HI
VSSNPSQKNGKIEFKWVKAHAGIFGNEIANRLAKEATQNSYITYRMIPKSAKIRIPGKKA